MEYKVNPTEIAPSLTEHEREIRDRYAAAYVDEYDVVRAAIRIGFSLAFAKTYGPLFFSEPYTANKIAELEAAKGIISADDKERAQIVAMLKKEARRENPYGGTGSSRVSALVQLSKILGIEAPTKVDVNDVTTPNLEHLLPAELEAIKYALYGQSGSKPTTH
jgi:hypothetical protein